MTAIAAPAGISTWNVDPTHTTVGFAVKHLMITTVKGHFGKVSGTVSFDAANLANTKADITIEVSSISTNNEQRDGHLKSADFFDAANHPTMHFVGRRAEGDINDEFKLIGDLTIHGTTREVTLNVTTEGAGNDPWGGYRAGFSAKTKISRGDFGLTWNQALEAGGVVVGDDVKIELDVQLVRQ